MRQSVSILYLTNNYYLILFCRGFSVETCIVVQHVGDGSTNSPGTSPVAKKPCPPVQVILIFSNSLIIHQIIRQRKSQLWRRFRYPVLISIDFDDFTSPFTPWVLFWLRRYIKHSRQCFISYPNTSNFVKNTPLRVVFSTLFSVFGYPNETLSLVFDILLL